MTKTLKKAKPQPTVTSFVPTISNDQAKREFVKAVSQTRDGANSCVEKFLTVMDMLTSVKSSFTLDDFLYTARPFELESSEVIRLFQNWVDKMAAWGKVTVIAGCYEQDLVVLV